MTQLPLVGLKIAEEKDDFLKRAIIDTRGEVQRTLRKTGKLIENEIGDGYTVRRAKLAWSSWLKSQPGKV